MSDDERDNDCDEQEEEVAHKAGEGGSDAQVPYPSVPRGCGPFFPSSRAALFCFLRFSPSLSGNPGSRDPWRDSPSLGQSSQRTRTAGLRLFV